MKNTSGAHTEHSEEKTWSDTMGKAFSNDPMLLKDLFTREGRAYVRFSSEESKKLEIT